jgi:hypothetical protein
LGAHIGAVIGLILAAASAVVGLIAGAWWGALVLCIMAYLIFSWIILTVVVTRLSSTSLLMVSLTPTDRQVAQMFHLYLITPSASTLYAGLLNVLRFALIVWGVICVLKGQYVLAGVSVVYFGATAWHTVRLDPYAYLSPRAAKGHAFSVDQLAALERIQRRRDQIQAVS